MTIDKKWDYLPVFEVRVPNADRTGFAASYKIYANGYTEGFPEGNFVVNRVPTLLASVAKEETP